MQGPSLRIKKKNKSTPLPWGINMTEYVDWDVRHQLKQANCRITIETFFVFQVLALPHYPV